MEWYSRGKALNMNMNRGIETTQVDPEDAKKATKRKMIAKDTHARKSTTNPLRVVKAPLK